MAIDFPASPTNGQTFIVGGVTYTFDNTKWTAVAVAGAIDAITKGNSSAEVIDTGSDGRFVVTTEGTERMRIRNDGSMFFGTSSQPSASVAGIKLDVPGNNFWQSFNAGTSSYYQFVFGNGNGTVGSISTSGSGTSYATSSDYRLKENIANIDGAITRLQQLKPSRFNFIADPHTVVDGFIAHEAQEVVPECITGEKDAVDDDGNPVYQGIDQSKLVPLLTAALQEAIGRIETLEGMVAVNNITIDEQQHQLSTLEARLTALEAQ